MSLLGLSRDSHYVVSGAEPPRHLYRLSPAGREYAAALGAAPAGPYRTPGACGVRRNASRHLLLLGAANPSPG